MDDDEVAHHTHGNLVAAFASLPAHVPDGFVERIGGVVVAATGSPVALFNEILPVDDPDEADALVEAVGRMRAAGLASLVQLRGGVDETLTPVVHGLGLVERPELSWPAMVLTPLPTGLDLPPGLEVRRAADRAGFDEYLHASAAIAGSDPAEEG